MKLQIDRLWRLLLILSAATLLWAGCSEEPNSVQAGHGTPDGLPAAVQEAAVAGSGYQPAHAGFFHFARRRADLTRLVVVGDSLGATQNSCVEASQTVNLYPSLIAQQAGVEMPVPLVSEPGFPPCLTLQNGQVVPSAPPDQFGWRINIGEPVYNLSVPGTRVQGAMDPAADIAFHGNLYPYAATHALILDLSAPLDWPDPPRTMVEWAIKLDPTTMIVWLGANDVLWSALYADPQFITGYAGGSVDAMVFARQYYRLMKTLRSNTDASIVVANIPDVTVIPYLTSAEQMLAAVAQQVPLTVEQLFFILSLTPGDYLTPSAPDAITAAIQAYLGTGVPQQLPGSVVFTAAEVDIAREATRKFNAIIGAVAWLFGAPVVDIHGLLNEADASGYPVGDQLITTDFLGGVFTLDGIHPTNTAQGVVANEFIDTMNRYYHTGIPPVDVEAIYATDPLIFPPAGFTSAQAE